MTLDQLVEAIRLLPQDGRAELVERILLDAHGGIAPDVGKSWRQEIKRRVEEIQSGYAQGVPLEDALVEARKRVGL